MAKEFDPHWRLILSEIQKRFESECKKTTDKSDQLVYLQKEVEKHQGRIYEGFLKKRLVATTGELTGVRFSDPLHAMFTLVACNYRGQWVKDARSTTFLASLKHLALAVRGNEENRQRLPNLKNLYKCMLPVYFEVFDRDMTFNERLLDVSDGDQGGDGLRKYAVVYIRFDADKDGSAPNGINCTPLDEAENQAQEETEEELETSEHRILSIYVSQEISKALLTSQVAEAHGYRDLADAWIKTIYRNIEDLLKKDQSYESFPLDAVSDAVVELRKYRADFDIALKNAQNEISGDDVFWLAGKFFPLLGRYSGVVALLRMFQGMLCHVGCLGRDVVTVVARPTKPDGIQGPAMSGCSVTFVTGRLSRKYVPSVDTFQMWHDLAAPYNAKDHQKGFLELAADPYLAMNKSAEITKENTSMDVFWRNAEEVGKERSKDDTRNDFEVRPLRNWLPIRLKKNIERSMMDQLDAYWHQNWLQVGNTLLVACQLAGHLHEGADLKFAWLIGPPEIIKRIEGTVSYEDRNFWSAADKPAFSRGTCTQLNHEEFLSDIEDVVVEAVRVYDAHFSVFQPPRVATFIDAVDIPHGLGVSKIIRLPFVTESICEDVDIEYGPMAAYAYASAGFPLPGERCKRGDTCVIVSRAGPQVTMYMAGEEIAGWSGVSTGWRPGRDLTTGVGSQKTLLRVEIDKVFEALKADCRDQVADLLTSVLIEIADERHSGTLVVLTNRELEPSKHDKDNRGEADYYDLTPDDLMMRWGRHRRLDRLRREILKSLLVMDGAAIVTVGEKEIRIQARKQVAADLNVFRRIDDRAGMLEAITFGTKHRSALALSMRLAERSQEDGFLATVITVSADGQIRRFKDGKWWPITSRDS